MEVLDEIEEKRACRDAVRFLIVEFMRYSEKKKINYDVNSVTSKIYRSLLIMEKELELEVIPQEILLQAEELINIARTELVILTKANYMKSK